MTWLIPLVTFWIGLGIGMTGTLYVLFIGPSPAVDDISPSTGRPVMSPQELLASYQGMMQSSENLQNPIPGG